MSMLEVPRRIASLPPEARRRSERLYAFEWGEARNRWPAATRAKAAERYGSLDALEHPKILTMINRIDGSEATYGGNRAKRPRSRTKGQNLLDLLEPEEQRISICPFCEPLKNTPANVFENGEEARIVGKTCMTAANASPYCLPHGMIIPANHSPTDFTQESIVEVFEVMNRWYEAAGAANAHRFMGWNCQWRAGASLEHAHMHLLARKHRPFPAEKAASDLSAAYWAMHQQDYWQEMFDVHCALDLGFETDQGVQILASIVPLNDAEVLIIGDRADESLATALFKVLEGYKKAGLNTWNVGVIIPPSDEPERETRCGSLPVIIRVVTRGSTDELASDLSILRLFLGFDCIALDPYEVFRNIAPHKTRP